MEMTLYESLAHTLIQEHGRSLFLNSYSSFAGLGTRFWRWLLLTHGEDVYALPTRMSLPEPASSFGSPTAYRFPAFTVSSSMALGISPLELYRYPSMGGFDHAYTPIHVATALLRFGTDQAELAKSLLSPDFLKQVYPRQQGSVFSANSTTNPYRPSDFGLSLIPDEGLTKPDCTTHIVDELGNAAWFSVDYLKRCLRPVAPAHWYGKLCELNTMFQLWTPLLERAALSLLHEGDRANRVGYKNRIRYLRGVTPEDARRALDQCDGTSEVLWLARGDVSASEMATGLRVLATVTTGPVQEARQYLGRALTFADLEKLTPRQALSILYHAPFAAVEEVITTHEGALGAMFFTLTSKEYLAQVTNCMSRHNDRARTWYPDTAEGNLCSTHHCSVADIRTRWDARMAPLIKQYESAKEWRERFLATAEPAVLLLALLAWKTAPEDPVPRVTIQNVLRSHPSILEVQHLLEEMPKFSEQSL